MEKKLDGNYTRILRAILNRSWRQHSTKQRLYRHLPPITKTIQVRRTRHAGHCWRSRVELIRDVLLWTPSHSWAKAGRPARTYIQQICKDTGWSPEDAMNDREGWRERVRDIRADGTTRWWYLNKLKTICLHRVHWFQVLLSNTNNSVQYDSFIFTHLNGFKYSEWANSFIWTIDGILSGPITPSQSGPEANGNEGVLQIPQISSLTIRCSLVLYSRHTLMQSMYYSTTTADSFVWK